MSALFRLDQTIAAVTGACGKLGPIWVEGLLEAGARVAALDLPSASPSAAYAGLAANAGDRLVRVDCDITNRDSIERAADTIASTFGGAATVLVNNAGVFAGASFAELAVAEFDRIVAANLRSAFLVTRAFLPGMRRRGRGDVFIMSSIAGLGAYPNGAAYCAAKIGRAHV